MNKLIENAKMAYSASITNYPAIHTNRFPTWEELTEAQRSTWIAQARTTSVTSANSIAG